MKKTLILLLSLSLIVTVSTTPTYAIFGAIAGAIQRATIIANQVTQIGHQITSIGKFTDQLTQLRNQFEHMKDATLGEIGALQDSFSDLISTPANLVSEQITWADDFRGEARRIVEGVEQMGRSGRSLRETWREGLRNADRLTDGDLPHLLADQPPDVIAQAVADFQRQRERADKRLVMEHTVADAAAHLSGAVAEAQASLDRLRNDANKSQTALGQKQLAAGATQGELLAGIAQLLAYQGAREAAERYEDEIARRQWEAQWAGEMQRAKTNFAAHRAAIGASGTSYRDGMFFTFHSPGQP